MRVRTLSLASSLNLDCEWVCEEGTSPDLTDVRFSDIVPELRSGGPRSRALSGLRLYRHQWEAVQALEKGLNVILVSGTGSGKTEAWVLYSLANGKKVLVLYPTLALSADQIVRIEDYYSSLGKGKAVVKVDRPTLGSFKTDAVRSRLLKAEVVITNPAFLMADLKRVAESVGKSYLAGFLREVDMVVIDELDFYGSRGASLLVAMLEIVASYLTVRKPQVVILTATLGNPSELASIISDITLRRTKVISGRPFKIRNCTYVVLGRSIERVRKEVFRAIKEYGIPDRELEEVVKDPRLFARNAFVVIEYLRRKGIRVALPYFDPAELISRYVNDDVVTVVFTPSIRAAEGLARRLRELCSNKALIATHHHLVPKKVRDVIEEAARATPPKVKIIVTVRTLLQGIDIGNIGRIVHYGLPLEVREFMQREGRKGRRRELSETETVIIPITSWDKAVASRGVEGVNEYSRIPLEKVYVVRNNKYSALFKSLFKAVLGAELSRDEIELLKTLNLVEKPGTLIGGVIKLSRHGIDVWNKLGFYEYGPPYGVRRALIGDREKELEPASRRDQVEKYQPGAIDVAEEAIVVSSNRKVIEEVSLKVLNSVIDNYRFLSDALESYESFKVRWGEKRDFISDVIRGKVSSYIKLRVYVPREGFGEYYEVPYSVRWVVESRSRVKLLNLNGTLIPRYEEGVIDLDVSTFGVYRDFTYGMVIEVDPATNVEDLKVGSAALRLILRQSPRYAISFRELEVGVDPLMMPLPRIVVWEPEASAVMEVISWLDVYEESLKLAREPPKLWFPLLKLVDRDAAAIVAMKGLKWGDVAALAGKLAKLLSRSEELSLGSVKVLLERPSRALKVMAVELLVIEHRDSSLFVLAWFNGDDLNAYVTESSGLPKDLVKVFEGLLREVIDGELTLVTSSKDRLRKLAYTRTLAWLMEKLEVSRQLVNPYEELKRMCGVDLLNVSRISQELGIELPRAAFTAGRAREEARVYAERLSRLTYRLYQVYIRLRNMGVCPKLR